MSDTIQNNPESQPSIQDQVKRNEILSKLKIAPFAFLKPLTAAQIHNNETPTPATHLLSWRRSGNHDKNAYTQNEIDRLLDYILMLETQLAIDAAQFRQKSIQSIIDNHNLDGFTPAKQ
jgi:hypothetical protein